MFSYSCINNFNKPENYKYNGIYYNHACTCWGVHGVGRIHSHKETNKRKYTRANNYRLKFLHTLIEESAGKIIKAEIKSVPIILIPITIVSAVSRAITVL